MHTNALFHVLNKMVDKINARNLYDRIAFFILIGFFIYLIWFFMFYQPLKKSLQSKRNQVTQIQNKNEATRKEITLSMEKLKLFHRQKKEDNHSYTQLLMMSKHLNKKLNKRHVGLNGSDEVANLLRSMVKDQPGLSVLRLNLTPESVENNIKSDRQGNNRSTIVRQKVVLVLQGNYISVFHYLNSLDALDWPLSWDTLDYKVVAYPMARIVIGLHTLSLDKEGTNV